MFLVSEFNLLTYEPINFYGLLIHKHTLAEISKFGKEQFDSLTNLLCIKERQLKQQLSEFYKTDEIPQDNGFFSPYNFFVRQGENAEITGDVIFLKLQLAFLTYIQRQVKIQNGNIVVLASSKDEEDFVFSKETFEEFQQIIRLINGYESLEDEEPEIQTDNLAMKKKFEEKRKLLKEAKEREREKQSAEDGMTLAEIISNICIFPSSYNMTNIWNLTIYQLFNQFQKLQLKEGYDHKMILLSSGMTDSKKLDVVYWMKSK